MSAKLLLGVDAGGTVTKAVAFDTDGHEVASGRASSGASTPHPGWVERDMAQAWEGCAEAIRRCLAGVAGRIAAVGVVGHNDGGYLIDERGTPVRAAILASDTRTETLLDSWRASGISAELLSLTGQTPFAASPIALAAWLAEHEPESLVATRWWLFCKDWLRFNLTGEIGTDPTEASCSFTSVADTAAGRSRYDDAILSLVGLDAVRAARPPLHPPSAVVGAVTAAAARATGLAEGTPVVCGSHDVDAATIGIGAALPGQTSIVAGTFSINQVVSTELHTDPRWQARAFLEPGQLLNMSTSPASASILEWFVRRLVNADADFSFLDTELAPVMGDESELVFLPYLYGSPMLPHATGTLIGLRGWHGRPHLLRALLEGVVCNHRLHLQALSSAFTITEPIRATGGAMRSTVWRQLFADGLGRRIEIPDTTEAGARGGAALAGIGVGIYSGLADAVARTVRVVDVREPDPGSGFDAVYDRFTRALRALGPLWSPHDGGTDG